MVRPLTRMTMSELTCFALFFGLLAIIAVLCLVVAILEDKNSKK